MRYFNTEGCCKPDEHYMVNLYERLNKIKQSYVDRGKYLSLIKVGSMEKPQPSRHWSNT